MEGSSPKTMMDRVKQTLDHVNIVYRFLERLREDIDNSGALNDDRKAALRIVKEDLKRCYDKFEKIKGRIEIFLFFHAKLGLKADVLRVISMKSELDTEVYGCTICLEVIKRVDQTWSCPSCYAVLHLSCVTSVAEHELLSKRRPWKCPLCRLHPGAMTSRCDDVPFLYKCFCGAIISPRPTEGVTAHGCGRRCQRSRHCIMDCHPAACPALPPKT